MNSNDILINIDNTINTLQELGINIYIDFKAGKKEGYGESLDNFNINVVNNIIIDCGSNQSIVNALTFKMKDIEIPDHTALKIIETFHHEIGHIIQRLVKLREENSPEAKILSLEYLLSQNSRWYKRNYFNTFMERGCEFRGYANTVLFIEGLDVPTERKEELYKALCENFEKAYKNVLPKKDRIIEGDTYETKALSITKILHNRSLEILEREKGIFFKKKYKDYLERNCKRFLKYAKPWERANETISALLNFTPHLKEIRDFNNSMRARDAEKHPEFGSKF